MSKLLKRVFAFGMSLCLSLCFVSASAATRTDAQDVFILNGDLARGAEWPTSFYDLSKSDYKAEIQNISTGKGVYASRYFECNASGELHISATMTCAYPVAEVSKIRFEIYLYDTKELVSSYAPSYYASYNETTISHTFDGLSTGKKYVVRFLNASDVVGWDNKMYGPITISH